jgi:hypothetical protein
MKEIEGMDEGSVTNKRAADLIPASSLSSYPNPHQIRKASF